MAFTVEGPLVLKSKVLRDEESKKTMRLVDGKASKELLSPKTTAADVGVYVFGVRKQGGVILPWYVGKTESSSLGKESLTVDKLRKYATALERSEGSTPVLYFLLPENGWDKRKIDRLETFLIWLSRQRNPQLLNQRKNLSPKQLESTLRTVLITGLQQKKTGPVTATIKSFQRTIGWTQPVHVVGFD